jgi:hypothetical protein
LRSGEPRGRGYSGDTHIFPLRFRINGHLFRFDGTSAERYAMERDLEDARKCLEAARSKVGATVE